MFPVVLIHVQGDLILFDLDLLIDRYSVSRPVDTSGGSHRISKSAPTVSDIVSFLLQSSLGFMVI